MGCRSAAPRSAPFRGPRFLAACGLLAALTSIGPIGRAQPVPRLGSPDGDHRSTDGSDGSAVPGDLSGAPAVEQEEAPTEVAADSPMASAVGFGATDIRSRPHTTFQLGIGLLALPGAEVCPAAANTCEPGETSVALSLKNMYHIEDFAVGAGITWAFGLRGGAAAGDASGTLGREHSRGYFLFEALFRYYPLSFGDWDVFAAANLGGVVVRDSWSVLADREPYSDTAFVGPRSATMGTEGLVVGLGLGLQWNFIENGIFGSWINYSNWFLPGDREATPTGDQASLAGRIDVFDFGLAVAYRLAI